MRPQLDGISLALSILLLGICFRGDTQGHATKCFPAVEVKRNTVFTGVVRASLRIFCLVRHCGLTPNLTWCKIETMDNCEPVKKTNGITDGWEKTEGELVHSFLLFGNLTLDDAGQYRCGLSGGVLAMGHYIKIVITATNYENISNNSNTTDRSSQEEHQGLIWLPYIYICAGIMLVIIIVVVISSLLTYGCKRSERSRKADPTNLQCEAPQIYHASPRPDLPTSRSPHIRHATSNGTVTIRTDTANQTAVEMDGRSTHDNERYRSESPIIYASLNHQAPKESMAHPTTSRVENSEYAAIRLY